MKSSVNNLPAKFLSSLMFIYVMSEISRLLEFERFDSGDFDAIMRYTLIVAMIFAIVSSVISIYMLFDFPGNLMIFMQLSLLSWMMIFMVFIQISWNEYFHDLPRIGFAGIYWVIAFGIFIVLLPRRSEQ